MRGQRVTPHPALSALPMKGRGRASPGKPPLCYPSGFQFGFELQLPGGGPRGPEGSGVMGRVDRKDLVPVSTLPTFSLSQGPPKGQRWEPQGFHPHGSWLPAATLTSWPKLSLPATLWSNN